MRESGGCSTSRTWASSSSAATAPSIREPRDDQRRRRARPDRCSTRRSSTTRHDRGRLPRLSLRRSRDDGRQRSNVGKDFAHIARHAARLRRRATRRQRQDRAARAAGPEGALRILQPLTEHDLTAIGTTTSPGHRRGVPTSSSRRTGYTGEDGFELYFPNEHAVSSGTPSSARRRHALRARRARHAAPRDGDGALRQRHRRHHHSPRGDLGWLVKLEKGRLRRARCARRKGRGLKRKLVGFTTAERNFPRHGYPVFTTGSRAAKCAAER